MTTFDESIEIALDRLVPAAEPLCYGVPSPIHDRSFVELKQVIDAPTMTIQGFPTPVPRAAPRQLEPLPPAQLSPGEVQDMLDELLDLEDAETVPLPKLPPRAKAPRRLAMVAAGALVWLAHLAATVAIVRCF